MSLPIMNRMKYEAARSHYGLKESVWINGEEFAQIPIDLPGLIFWAFDKIATPIFGEDGELRDWKVADVETTQKIIIIVEEIARANGFDTTGFKEFFE